MKLLITGGAGMIGSNIAEEAKNRGHEVVVFDSFIRNQTETNIPLLKKLGVTVIRGDIRNSEDFFRIPEVDAIIHLAGNPGIPWSLQSPLYDFEVNAKGTINVLEYARTHSKIPVIFASTNKTYSDLVNLITYYEKDTRYEWHISSEAFINGSSIKGISENFPTEGFGKYPHSPYGVSKLAADHYCQEYSLTFGVPTVINRMSCIYGYHQLGVEDQGWISHFVRTMVNGDNKINIYGTGKQVRDMLWAGDVAKLYLNELENIDKLDGMVYNVGGGVENTLSIIEAIKIIEDETNKKAEITFHPKRVADQDIYISDISKVSKELGWQPQVSPKQGIKMMIEEASK